MKGSVLFGLKALVLMICIPIQSSGGMRNPVRFDSTQFANPRLAIA